jgi:hypothetical protein
MAATATLGPTLGPIEPHILYPLDDLKARSGMGASALRTLRRDGGLEVRYCGGRGYIMGRDFIDAVMRNGKDSK